MVYVVRFSLTIAFGLMSTVLISIYSTICIQIEVDIVLIILV